VKLLNPKLPPKTVQAKKLKALVLDWAGTTVDFGSCAPARTLQRVFAKRDIHLTEGDLRQDMGLAKRHHIEAILSKKRVRERWQALRGHLPTQADVGEMYAEFLPLQLSCLVEYSAMIPGVVEAIQRFRERGLKIGSTTGYTRAMLNLLLECSAKAGYHPDCSVAPEDVVSGRPEPFMIYENAIRLQVYPLAAVAKVGDTPADVEEGLNAGVWSIGVIGTGNGVGLSYEEFQGLPAGERESRLSKAGRELEQAGAHYVVDTLDELDPVLDDIEARLKQDAAVG
jgi:phosphonoacetaldehyde hydrolase